MNLLFLNNSSAVESIHSFGFTYPTFWIGFENFATRSVMKQEKTNVFKYINITIEMTIRKQMVSNADITSSDT